ncbi:MULTISPECIES: hypothetical protein [unclassified Castellaniella]|uniref:hypothetical protein n=1 Tax=unclassified Castellaniella TaxID=2617606 RepID=UPI00331563C4
MTVQTLGRCGLLLTVLLLSACSSTSSSQWMSPEEASQANTSTRCSWLFGSCGYEGSYEPGEAVYAEQEAARLNRAQLSRLKGF